MNPRWSEVTALFGGTFDPPHLGHREAVRGLFTQPGVKRVLILPSPIPPHKTSHATTAQRVEMTKRCFSSLSPQSEASIDLRELERAQANPGLPSYSYDTILDIQRMIPEIAFVIGTDQFEQISTWHRFPDLLDLCHWIVLQRKQRAEIGTLQALTASGLLKMNSSDEWQTRKGKIFKFCPTDAPAVSSTHIREIIAKTGNPPENALTPEVQAYLKLHRIYGTRGSD